MHLSRARTARSAVGGTLDHDHGYERLRPPATATIVAATADVATTARNEPVSTLNDALAAAGMRAVVVMCGAADTTVPASACHRPPWVNGPGAGRGDHPDRVTTAAAASGTLGCMDVQLPWPVRSVIAGTIGTAALTLAYALERRLRPRSTGPLDYDDGLVPGEIVAGIMHLPHVTAREERDLGLVLRWSYGSAFGLLHGVLRRSVGEPWASVGFGGTLMTATLTMFPLLGRTPPPWRWRPDVMATSLATHACYVGAVAAVDDQILRRTR